MLGSTRTAWRLKGAQNEKYQRENVKLQQWGISLLFFFPFLPRTGSR